MIFILGNTGMLGNYVTTYFNLKQINHLCIDKTILDANNLNNLQEFFDLIQKYQPSYIINCIGLIRQRKNVSSKDMIQVNSIFPNVIFYLIKEKFQSIKFIHLSTDCVFNSNMNEQNENDKHQYIEDGNDIYGTSKSAGENQDMMIIRTSIIGEEKYNKLSLIEYVKSRSHSEINGYVDHFWNGVTCLELSQFLEYIIQNTIDWKGVRHIFSPDIISKYQLIEYINSTWNLNLKINQVQNGYKKLCLSTIYQNEFQYQFKSIIEQLQELKTFSIYLNI